MDTGERTLDPEKNVIDISRPISPNSVVHPDDENLKMEKICSTDEAVCDITELGWTTHFLTHVDPPAHFVESGDTLEEVEVSRWIGKAEVIEVEGDSIGTEDVPDDPEVQNILFKTSNSQISTEAEFQEDYVYIEAEAAQKLADKGFNLVGVDYINVDQFGDGEYPAHTTLLENNVLILEGLDLEPVEPGDYTLVALPLKIEGEYGDGSPVRAVLLEQ